MGRLLVISGAGLSVESGVRAFRTDTDSGRAMWDEYDLEEVCNIHAFNGNFYYKTHSFYNKRREELGTVEPNLAHLRIAEWYNTYPNAVLNITTNVDDLLERAGVDYGDVVHVHGYLRNLRHINSEGDSEELTDIGYVPVDADAFHWCKPDVVFFGEMAPKYQDMYNIVDEIGKGDVVIVVGCSNQVIDFNWVLYPAKNRGAKIFVINPVISLSDRYQYEDSGVTYLMKGAVDAFSDPDFLNQVEEILNNG